MTAAAASFLDDLKNATSRADAAESALRQDFSARLKSIEQDRAFAYRRFNLMRAMAEGIAGAESEEIAVANALGVLRTRLGWHSDSEVREAVLANFAPVGRAVFMSFAPPEAEADEPDVMAVLKTFESWYAEKHGTPFWILFENYMPETPVVDF
jgi:hypothetical protein